MAVPVQPDDNGIESFNVSSDSDALEVFTAETPEFGAISEFDEAEMNDNRMLDAASSRQRNEGLAGGLRNEFV